MSCLLSRPCVICARIFKWLPVVLITTIVAWSYYAYVIQLCAFKVESYVEKVLYLIVFHQTFVMFVWSYWQTIFTDPGGIPKNFYLPPEVAEAVEKEPTEPLLESYAKGLPIHCRNFNRTVRYCDKCNLLKPDRAHHCSVCSRCIPKMDHHCPWVNNCVGFGNYKFFVLFLGYAIIYCVFVAATTCRYFIRFWTGGRKAMRDDSTGLMTVEGWGRLHILFLFFVAIMFAISLVSLFCYHCRLVCLNRTTLECFRTPVFFHGPDEYAFHLGFFMNFREVFGEDKRMWFIPIFTSLGDGVEYPLLDNSRSQRHMGLDVDAEAGHLDPFADQHHQQHCYTAAVPPTSAAHNAPTHGLCNSAQIAIASQGNGSLGAHPAADSSFDLAHRDRDNGAVMHGSCSLAHSLVLPQQSAVAAEQHATTGGDEPPAVATLTRVGSS